MREWLETQGYLFCWRGDWISRLWSPIWFHFYCPYPIQHPWTARACNDGGLCGCSNAARLAHTRPHHSTPTEG